MKVLFAIVLIVVTLSNANTQPKGVDFDNAVTMSEANYEDNYESLCKQPDVLEGYLFYFRATTIGVKHSHDKVLELLLANNLKFDEPYLNRDYLGDYINGITDYENISFYTGLDKAEIYRVWLIKGGPWGIKWAITGGLVTVMIQPFTTGEVERQQQVELERLRQTEKLNNLGTNAFGSQGVINGSLDADHYDTGGGLGNNPFSYGLGARRARGKWPHPNMSGCDVTQKIEVKVEIQVDRDGNVISALVQSATYQDKCIWDMVVEAAKKSKFSPDQAAAYRQTGWIKCIIVP